jgi:5,10-methenyltetrahydrofolate synthetase
MNKIEFRNDLKRKRLGLGVSKRAQLSQRICQQLQTLDWRDVIQVHCYEPLLELGEVDIGTFMRWLTGSFPHINLFTSKRFGQAWRIVAQKDQVSLKKISFDVVIVPMLGCDISLNRIGYGGGYYDKLLIAQPQAQKIGVCFEICRVAQLPVQEHDVPMDRIVTERQIYQ